VFIKESKKITKLKLRGKKYLYTFKTADKEKAKKLIQSLPQSTHSRISRPDPACQQQEDQPQEEEQEVSTLRTITRTLTLIATK
jgi:Ribosomal L38e protein family